MIITERTGYSAEEGVGHFAEAIDGQFKAAAAITSGDTCCISALATEESKPIVTVTSAGTTATKHLIMGAYQGIGGRGSDNTTSGSPGGKDALSGDIIYVRMHGIATTLVDGGTTDVAANDCLMMKNSATGTLIIAVAAASNVDGSHYNAVALEANTGAAAFKKVYFRCV